MKPTGFNRLRTKGFKNGTISLYVWGKKMVHHSNFDFYININELPAGQNKFMAMLEYAFMERIRCNKITVVVLTGDTSEGKSSISQALVEEFCRLEGINYADFVDDVTIYTPLEYPEKQKALLFDERLKPIQFMIIDEGRLVVRAKDWFSYINQVIADIFAMQRRIKRLLIIINTQSLEDIDKDLRRRITFWGIVYRPLHEKARLYLNKFWDDMREPENIRLKKRMFRGIVEEDGVKKILTIPFIKFPLPSKAVWDKYDDHSYIAKAAILKKKLNDLLESMKAKYGVESDRVNNLFNFYTKPENIEELYLHGAIGKKGEFKLKKKAIEIFGLLPEQAKQFNEKANKLFSQKILEQNSEKKGDDLIGIPEKVTAELATAENP